jgi:hypothetical protein
MNYVRADLRQLDLLDIPKQSSPLVGTPQRRMLTASEKKALKSTLALSKKFNPQLGLLEEPISVAEKPPSLVVIPPAKVPVGMAGSGAKVITLGVGLQVSAMAVVGVSAQGGIYGATTHELGAYFSIGGGWWTNIGANVGPVITFIFGPPSDMAGVAIGIGADVKFMAGAIGGLLLFSMPPIRFLGFAISLAVGPSAIPAFDVTIQVNNTWTKPILK